MCSCHCQGTCAVGNKPNCWVQRAEERLIMSLEYLFSLLLEDQTCTWRHSKDAIRHTLLHFLGHGILHLLILGSRLHVSLRLWRRRETFCAFVLGNSIRISIILITVLVCIFSVKNNTSFHLQRCTLPA